MPRERAAAVTPEVLRDLAPRGMIRAAINLGNAVLAQKGPQTGAPRGVTVDLARELGARLGRDVSLVPYETAGQVVEARAADAWDLAFLAIDPLRAAEIAFSAPYVLIEGAYVVRTNASFCGVADVDRAGVRVAVGGKSAYDLFLSRTLKQAQIVRAPGSAAALELFLNDNLEVGAGIRQPISAFAKAHAGLRVIDEPFMEIRQAMAVPKDHAAGARFVAAFIEEMKASGFVAKALAASGQHDAVVAPPA